MVSDSSGDSFLLMFFLFGGWVGWRVNLHVACEIRVERSPTRSSETAKQHFWLPKDQRK